MMESYNSYAYANQPSGFSPLLHLAVSILSFAALWKIFTKAGEKGWKALIPFYGGYIRFKISWTVKMFWIMLACFPGCTILAVMITMTKTALAALGPLLMFAGILAFFIIAFIGNIRLANAFGKGGVFAVGLTLLPPVFMCILAFDSSIVYVDPKN